MSKIGILGAGHMASAIARAAAAAAEPGDILIYNRTAEKAEALAAELGGRAVALPAAAAEAELLFLGVTPQGLDAVLALLAPLLAARTTPCCVASMVAGQSIDRLQAELPGTAVIRFMPNTPIGIGQGMVLYTPSGNVTAEQEALFCGLLSPSARLLKLREEQIDPVTCVTGCSIAYTYLYIEALARHAAEFGVPAEEAFAIAAKSVAGAAELALASGETPQALIDQVCTPGGTSIEGVKTLRREGLEELVERACGASLRRCEELRK